MSEFFSSAAVQIGQPASVKVCAEQCKAKCCQAPGHVILTQAEAQRLGKAAKRKGKALAISIGAEGQLAMDFDLNGGKCVFLLGNKTCGIYNDRPGGCRTFPNEPMRGCLVSPSDDPSDPEVVVRRRKV